MALNDTIMAASSAAGVSPRAIIRLSGIAALGILEEMTIGNPRIPHQNYRAFQATLSVDDIRLPSRVYIMRAPASYTREDIVEIHTFGSPPILKALMNALAQRGARPADPGEFTKRAFLNGRLDLAQAEAVQTIIRARTEAEFRAAASALSGRLSAKIADLRKRLTDLAVVVELSLDFSEHDVDIISEAEVSERLGPVRDAIHAMLANRERGRLDCHAVRAVLFGPPNAGKSSLFNTILNRSRAIVSPHPGTTRDTIEAITELEGMELLLVDTAGLRPSVDEVEIEAVMRSQHSIQRADLGLCVLDASADPDSESAQALESLEPDRTMILLNKSDKGDVHPRVMAALPRGVETVRVSATDGTGIANVLDRVHERVTAGQVDRGPRELMVNARQAGLLQHALQATTRAMGEDGQLRSMDLTASDIRDAITALDAVTGEPGADYASSSARVTEDVLDRIFSTFCIGK